jgi:MYXO-CTERM domain-containing protein
MRSHAPLGLLACAVGAGVASADVITVYTDRASFEAAANTPLTVEDFTDGPHFPIRTGILNSHTNLPEIGLFPGDIEAGVTYSTPIGNGNFFNIDAGGGYTGGFLDGFEPSDREVTVDFHFDDPNDLRNVYAFGFDIGSLGSTDFDVRIFFANGTSQHFNFPYPDTISFFGFQSDARDITSVVIGNNGGFFGFDFDNFTYDEVPAPGALAVLGLGGLVAARRRRA